MLEKILFLSVVLAGQASLQYGPALVRFFKKDKAQTERDHLELYAKSKKIEEKIDRLLESKDGQP